MDPKEGTRSWLANNALLAFVGALLMGQTWQASGGTATILGRFTVPDYSGFVVFAIIVLLFLLSIFLAVAAFVPTLQRYAFQLRPLFSPILGILIWCSFTLGWLTMMPKLPWDQWWSLLLMLGGMCFSFVFIPLWYLLSRPGK